MRHILGLPSRTETDNERDIGIQLSKDLKWNLQAKKSGEQSEFSKTLYTTFVRPHLEYAQATFFFFQGNTREPE